MSHGWESNYVVQRGPTRQELAEQNARNRNNEFLIRYQQILDNLEKENLSRFIPGQIDRLRNDINRMQSLNNSDPFSARDFSTNNIASYAFGLYQEAKVARNEALREQREREQARRQQEAERRQREAEERRRRQEEQRRQREEEDRRRREEQERRRREEEERRRRAEEDRRRREEEERYRREEEDRRRREEEERYRREEQARRRREEEQRIRREEEEQRIREAEERRQLAEELRRQKAAKIQAENERAEFEARMAEERRKAEAEIEQIRKQAAEQAAEEAKIKAQIDEERRRAQAEIEQIRKQAAQQAEEEAKLQAQIAEERRKAQEEIQKAQEEAKRQAQEYAEHQARLAEEKRKEAEEAKQLQAINDFYQACSEISDTGIINFAQDELDKLEADLQAGIFSGDVKDRIKNIIEIATLKKQAWSANAQAEAARESLKAQLETEQALLTKTITGEKGQALSKQISELKNQVTNANEDSLKDLQNQLKDLKNTIDEEAVNDQQRKEVAKSLVATLQSLNFTVERNVQTIAGNGDNFMVLKAKKPSGDQVECRLGHKRIAWKLNEKAGDTCIKNSKEIALKLEECYGIKLSEEREIILNPDRIQKNATNIPSADSQNGRK